MADEALERELPPSERRRRYFRERGQVGRSREMAGAVVLLAGLLGLLMVGPGLSRLFGQLLAVGVNTGSYASPLDFLGRALGQGMSLLVAPLLLMVAAAVLAHLVQGDLAFSPLALEPRWDRIDPVARFKQIFLSRQTLVELVKALAKVVVVGAVCYWAISEEFAQFSLLNRAQPGGLLAKLASSGWRVGSWGALALLALALGDVVWQRWENERRMRMNPQEMKEEYKEQEGDPLLRGRRRQRHRELLSNLIAREVPRADVVLTNPTHLAVALRYDRKREAAPRLTAKGSGELARRIRELAIRHGVPVLENKPLARWLYRRVKVGRPVPAAVYQAVAEIYAFVYRLKRSE